MHETKDAEAFTLRRRDGATWNYRSMPAMLADLKRDAGIENPGLMPAQLRRWGFADAFTGWTELDGEGRFRARHPIGTFVVEDTRGERIPIAAIGAVLMEEAAARRAARRARPHVFRDGPVPSVGAKRRSYRGLRNPSTTAERREATADDADVAAVGFDPGRVRRSRALPTSWSDVPRHRERTWKRHRATKWRG